MRVGVYAGSFDPITYGHIDIMFRSLKICDKLIMAVGINPGKNNMFSVEDRIKHIKEYPAIKYELSKKVDAIPFQGLLVDFAKQHGASILIRGIRSVSDFEYEINLANVNKTLCSDIDTVFFPTKPELTVVSSSMVKEIAKLGGNISSFVPIHVADALQGKLGFIKHGQ